MWVRSVSCIVSALVLLSGPSVAVAQAPAKPYRIGWLSDGAPPSGDGAGGGELQQALREAGYVEGRNFVIEYRYAAGNVERLPGLAAELVRARVDVIVTSGEPAALAAQQATRTIPIVVTQMGIDPVKAGLVTSLGRPEANITGLATLSDDLWEKRLGLLKQVAPKVSRLGVLRNPSNPGNAGCVDQIRVAAGLRFQVLALDVRDAGALEQAFASMTKEHVDALAICWDTFLLGRAAAIADFALKTRLPTLTPLKEYVEAGCLLSMGLSLPAHKRRTAYYVDKTLKGTKPADLPVEQAAQFDLVVNLKTAKALGLKLPDQLLLVATEIVQ